MNMVEIYNCVCVAHAANVSLLHTGEYIITPWLKQMVVNVYQIPGSPI